MTYCKNLYVCQISEASERLGVPPKSSPNLLRQHHFFTGGKVSLAKDDVTKPWTFIDWEILWTTPAPSIEVGPYRSRPREIASDTEELWDGFESLKVEGD